MQEKPYLGVGLCVEHQWTGSVRDVPQRYRLKHQERRHETGDGRGEVFSLF